MRGKVEKEEEEEEEEEEEPCTSRQEKDEFVCKEMKANFEMGDDSCFDSFVDCCQPTDAFSLFCFSSFVCVCVCVYVCAFVSMSLFYFSLSTDYCFCCCYCCCC